MCETVSEMSEFRADVQKMHDVSVKSRHIAKKTKDYGEQIGAVGGSLSFEIASKNRIRQRLNQICDRVRESGGKIERTSNVLDEAAVLVEVNEVKLAGVGAFATLIHDSLSDLFHGTNNSGSEPSFLEKLFGDGFSGAVLSGAVTSSCGPAVFSAAGDLLGYSATGSFTSGVKWKDNDKDGKYELDKISLIEAEAKVEGHLAHGKAGVETEHFSASAEGTLGQVAAAGAVGLSIVSDGKFQPQLYAEAKASAKAVEGKAKAEFGNDTIKGNLGAKGSLLGAEAKAKGAVGVIKEIEEDGTATYKAGIQGEVKAGAYLAEGEVSGGFELFGIKITGTLGGKAGGVGASAKASVTTGGIEGKVGLGLIFGAEVGIKIDWTGFKWPEFPKLW